MCRSARKAKHSGIIASLLVVVTEAGMLAWLNLSANTHIDRHIHHRNYGWPATYRGERFEIGVGSSHMRMALKRRTLRSGFSARALFINLVAAGSIMALSTMVAISSIADDLIYG